VEDPEHREYMYYVEVSEVDGRFLLLYTSRDTSRVGPIYTRFITVLTVEYPISQRKTNFG
jgi:hypothetical protein